MDDEAVQQTLRRIADRRELMRTARADEEKDVRTLLATRRYGIRAQVAKALGISTQAVWQKYGPIHRNTH